MKIPRAFRVLRRNPARKGPTAEEMGAQVFTEHAEAMFDQTRQLVDAIRQGRVDFQQAATEQPDYVRLVRAQRASLLRKIEEELVLLEMNERMQRLAELRELQKRHPDLFAGVLGTGADSLASAVTTPAEPTIEKGK